MLPYQEWNENRKQMASIVARVSKATKAPMDQLLSSAEAWEMVRAGYFTRTHQKELAKECLAMARDYSAELTQHLERTGKG